jgi:hypothetical protein
MNGMNKVPLALSLALVFLPIGALADSNPAPPPTPSASQRQAMFQTMRSFAAQERQLWMHLRSGVLGALSSAHRTAVGNVIAQQALSSNPNPKAAGRQIDGILSSGERQQILSAMSSFRTQSQALHAKMRAQIQSQMPAGAAMHTVRMPRKEMGERHQPDPGMIVLHALATFGPMQEHHLMMLRGGPPPPAQP